MRLRTRQEESRSDNADDREAHTWPNAPGARTELANPPQKPCGRSWRHYGLGALSLPRNRTSTSETVRHDEPPVQNGRRAEAYADQRSTGLDPVLEFSSKCVTCSDAAARGEAPQRTRAF